MQNSLLERAGSCVTTAARNNPVAKRALVLLTDAYGGHGGIAKFNRDLLSVLGQHPDYKEIIALPRNIESSSSDIIPSTVYFDSSSARHKLAYAAALARTLLRNRSFDLILCGHLHLLPLAWLASQISRAPLMQICHGIEAWSPTSRKLVDSLTNKIDYLVCVSSRTKDRFQAWTSTYPVRAHILPNTVDMNRFRPMEKNQRLITQYRLNGKIVLLTLGRLERSKGVDEILAVMPDLVRDMPNIVYMVVGGGSDLVRLRAKAHALGLTEKVIFTDRIKEEDKVDYYNLADSFVMPGRGEGFGIVYLEAMACGVPVLASIADGSQEAVLNGRLGVLVDPDDLSSVKQGIHEKLRRGKGIPQGLDYFSMTQFRERLFKILNALSANSSLRPMRPWL